MFFLKKQHDTINLIHGTLEINNFVLDGWTTDELFLKVYGENATPSRKQATYVLRDIQARLNEIEFNSVMVQFSPLGYQRQRVAENITLYAQPCKHVDFTKRVLDKLPDVVPEVYNAYELVAYTFTGMKVTAKLEPNAQMASLNIEYLNSASRVDNWIPEGCDAMVTPKSGAVKLFEKAYHANLRENAFKSEVMPQLSAPAQCEMNENTMLYTFRNIMFYDIQGDISFGFLGGKLTSIELLPHDNDGLLQWAQRHFGQPLTDEGDYLHFRTRAAGAREWYIRVYKQQNRMEWALKMSKYC